MKTLYEVKIKVEVDHEEKAPDDFVESIALDSVHFTNPIGRSVKNGGYEAIQLDKSAVVLINLNKRG